jgi:hypothetical protein
VFCVVCVLVGGGGGGGGGGPCVQCPWSTINLLSRGGGGMCTESAYNGEPFNEIYLA